MTVVETSDDDSHVDASALEAAVERFEVAWQGDVAPRLESFLTGTGPQWRALLKELVAVDLKYRLKRDEPARVENYLLSYPELESDVEFCLQLTVDEFAIRQKKDSQVCLSEYLQRFPQLSLELKGEFAKNVARSGSGRQSKFSARLNCPHCQIRLKSSSSLLTNLHQARITDKALQFARRAVELERQAPSISRVNVALSLSRLAELESVTGELETAAQHFQEALERSIKRYGEFQTQSERIRLALANVLSPGGMPRHRTRTLPPVEFRRH